MSKFSTERLLEGAEGPVDSPINPVCKGQINALEVYLKIYEMLDAKNDSQRCQKLSRWHDEVADGIRESEGRRVGEILGWNTGATCGTALGRDN